MSALCNGQQVFLHGESSEQRILCFSVSHSLLLINMRDRGGKRETGEGTTVHRGYVSDNADSPQH